MAVTDQNRSNFTENLKEVWEPAYAEFLNNSDRTRAQFDMSSQGVVQGKYVKASAHIGRNSGFAFTAEGGQTPSPGHQTFMNTLINLKKAIGRIQLSTEVIEDSATDTSAVADAMSVEKDGLGRDARREINFDLYAGNGIIATSQVVSSSTTVALNAATPVSVMRYLFDVVAAGGTDTGLVIDAGPLSNPQADVNGVQVTGVNIAAKSITVGSAVSITAGHFIYRHGQGGNDANTGQLAPSSIPQMISATAPLYGADPASFPLWASTAIDAAGVAVTEGLYEEAFDLLDIATGTVYGDGTALILSTHANRKELAASFQDRVRYAPIELKGGFSSTMTLQCAGGPVGLLVDRDCPDHTSFLVDPDSIVRIVGKDWEFMEQSGSPLLYDKDTDSYHLLLRSRFEYLCKNRRGNAVITNLGITTPY